MKSRNFSRQIILYAGCLCIALNLFFLLRPGSFGWNLARAVGDSNQVMHAIGAVDRAFAEIVPNTNAYLGFEHFSADNAGLAEMLYYRSCYAAYPAKVLVAPIGTVINRSSDFLTAPFEPDEEWMNEQRISREVIYDQKPSGNIKASVMTREIK